MSEEMTARSRSTRTRYRFVATGAVMIMILIVIVECRLTVINHHPSETWAPSLMYGAVVGLWWLGILEIFWQLLERWPSAMRVSTTTLAVQLACGAVFAYLHLMCIKEVVRIVLHVWPELQDSGFGSLHLDSPLRVVVDILLYGLAWGTCVSARYQMVERMAEIRSLELERQLSSAHLRALQMQIEPHFLFNTLNAITALVESERRDQALMAIVHLNTILRTTFKRTTPNKIPLAQELQVVESYLALQQIRYADRLRIHLDVQSEVLDGLVPCFLLQPLIENAIRHGIAKLKGTGVITTSAVREGDSLLLTVRDNGLGRILPSEPGNGIGLKNTQERLTHFYEDMFTFSAMEVPGGGFEVAITIPYERMGA